MRLITRGNLDGLLSSVLLSAVEDIESIELIHPQAITDKRIDITDNDIIANLPFHTDCGMWFDHHQMSDNDKKPPENFRGLHKIAPSVAGVIYEYYASDDLKKYESYIEDTDRFDSAQLSMEDVTDPQGLILLGFTIDSRSGLGHFKDYFKMLVKMLQTMPLDAVLSDPDVVERAKRLRDNNADFLKILKNNSRVDGNVVITDFRPLDKAPVGNRFLVYALFPETNVSLRLQWGPDKKFIAATLGHSIFNRASKANCGDICSAYGGGGHAGAAGCPLDLDKANEHIAEIVNALKKAG